MTRLRVDASDDPDDSKPPDTDDLIAVLRSAPASDGCPFVSIAL
jgi:hypothetical protein